MNDSHHAWALFLLALHNCRFVQRANVPQLLTARPRAELRLGGEPPQAEGLRMQRVWEAA